MYNTAQKFDRIRVMQMPLTLKMNTQEGFGVSIGKKKLHRACMSHTLQTLPFPFFNLTISRDLNIIQHKPKKTLSTSAI